MSLAAFLGEPHLALAFAEPRAIFFAVFPDAVMARDTLFVIRVALVGG
jgi:hypothetical protein